MILKKIKEIFPISFVNINLVVLMALAIGIFGFSLGCILTGVCTSLFNNPLYAQNSSCPKAAECNLKCNRIDYYTCYQGFCWQCEQKPDIKGGILDLKGAKCRVAVPFLCEQFIGSTCKAKGKE